MKEVLGKTTVTGECRGIPAELSVGMELPDYEIEIKVMFITSKMGCTDRKVIGRESVTTPAGTFDCFVVEETMTAKAMMVKEKTRQVSWYARPGQAADMGQEETYRDNSFDINTLKV